jgi:hypothetical protein
VGVTEIDGGYIVRKVFVKALPIALVVLSISLPVFGAAKKSYQQNMQDILDEWKKLAAKDSVDITAIDMYLGDKQVHKLNFDLDPAVYSIQALTDMRCTDLRITVFDSSGTVLAKSLGGDNYPYCEFLLDKKQNIRVEIKPANFPTGAKETYVDYLIECLGKTDDASRHAYVQKRLDSLRSFVVTDKAELVDSSTGNLSRKEHQTSFSYDLEPGTYLCSSFGGLLMPDINLAVYDENGTLLTDDTKDDSHPACLFTLSNEQNITFQITVVSFRGNSPSEYFCWCLSRGDVYNTPPKKPAS